MINSIKLINSGVKLFNKNNNRVIFNNLKSKQTNFGNNNNNLITFNFKRNFTSNNKMSEGAPKAGATEENNRINPKDTFFAKIVSGEVPVPRVYEDDYCIAFNDINPVAPVHVLVIPKYPVGGVGDVANVDLAKHKEAMGHIMATIPHIASLKGIDSYRLVINEGAHAGQSVRWLHIHIIGGRQMNWPPG